MNTILFDLDGTLLPMDLEQFTKRYFMNLQQTLTNKGRDGKKILNAVLMCLESMFKNDGKQTNEEVFWKSFTNITNIKKEEIEKDFEDFYKNEFNQVYSGEKSQLMIDSVNLLKEKGYRLILATNPLFPKIATQSRVRWAGLDPNVFEWITTYENSSFCKPNPDYFKEILDRFDLNKENCMMVGNDMKEDGAIQYLGIDLYLIEDYLINSDHLEINCKWHGQSKDFFEYVKELPYVG